MDDEDADSVPVKDSNDNNNVKRPRKNSAGAAKPSAAAASAMGTKRPSKTPQENEVGKKKLAPASASGTAASNNDYLGEPPQLAAVTTGGNSRLPPADTGDNTSLIRARQDVSRWDRAVLEDKYLRLLDDEIVLKRHCRKQEERIKKMSVKLIRLAADKRSAATARRGGAAAAAAGAESSAVVAETLAELEAQVRKQEKEKQQLEERYVLLREQLQTVTSAAAASHRASQAYDGVPPRIDSGVKRDARVAKGLRVAGPSRSGAGPDALASQRSSLPPPSPQKLPRYGHSLLEDAREQIQYMESIIEQQNEQIRICEEERRVLEEEMERKERGFEEDLLRIRQEATGVTRAGLQENVDLIRLQREVKDKAARILSMQTQYDSLEANMRSLKESHGSLLKEMEGLNSQLLAEQSRNISLQNQLKRNPSDLAHIKELEESFTDAKKEIHVLKEANEKLVASAFDMEREREWRKRENALKVQIAQLEATLKADLGEKGNILDRLTAEREATERRDNEFRQLQKEYFKVKEQCEQMQEKASFFSKESAIDFSEIEEALILLKHKKEKDTTDMSFLSKVDDEKHRDLEKQMMVLQADYAETIEELEKTRNLLIVQHQINKDYQLEVEAVTKKMDENRREYDAKLDEYAQLLDIRAARIRKLELQLRDIAYGTKQYKLRTAGSSGGGADDAHGGVGSDVEEIDETIHLERGENLFEIHIDKLTMTREALAALADDEPALFCTWEFFEHEIQATAVVKGPIAVFDFTSQYIVRVDDFFLHHLQKESTALEVHQAIGTEYRTIATCRLHFRDIFDKAHGRLHGTVDIWFEVADDTQQQQQQAVSRLQLGTLSFWVRLRVPMDQALRLYKERTKALGYISSNEAAASQRDVTGAPLLSPDNNVNELHVKIFKAANVKARQTDVQPSPYCIYKFFDFPDHDTAIITNSNSPVFNDLKVFPVVMAADLDSYLKSAALEIFVFDDTDPEMTAYLGMASVPLMALAHDKAIKGTFELKKADGSVNGTIDVFLKWQCAYLPPDAATRIPAQGALARSAVQPRVGGSGLALMRGEQVHTVTTAAVPGQRQQQQRNVVVLVDDEAKESEADDKEWPRQDKRPAEADMRPQVRAAAAGAQKVIRPVTSSPKAESVARKQMDTASTKPKKSRSLAAETAPPSIEDEVSPVAASRSESYADIKAESAIKPSPPATGKAPKSKSSSKMVAAAAAGQVQQSQTPPGPTPSSRQSLAPRAASALPPSGASAPEANPVEDYEETLPEAVETDGSLTVTSLSTDVTSPVPAPGMVAKGNKDLSHSSQSAQSVEAGGFNTELTTEIEEDDEEEDDEEQMAAAVAAASAAANDLSKTSSADEADEDTRLDDGTLDGSGEVDLPITGTHDSETIDDNAEPEMHSDSDGVVSPVPRRSLSALPKDGIVTIAVNHLSIEDGSRLLTDPAVQRLFVAYSFLDCEAAELETPVSLPKPDHLNRPLQYNFRRVFRVDAEANLDKRQYLASMLLADAPDQGRIIFTVVSEPPEDDQNSECMDVGTASVSLLEIVKKKQDLIDTNIDVKSVQNGNEVIGALNVTVECLAVLESIKDEFILT